jgi:hypothetical protein
VTVTALLLRGERERDGKSFIGERTDSVTVTALLVRGERA